MRLLLGEASSMSLLFFPMSGFLSREEWISFLSLMFSESSKWEMSGARRSENAVRFLPAFRHWCRFSLHILFLSLQMMSALTASPLTKWPGCIAIWTSYTSNGVKAESPPPFPSHPWLLGKPKSPSLSTGCLLLVELYMTGERGTPLSLKHFKGGKEYKVKRTLIVMLTCTWLPGVTSWVYSGLSSLARLGLSHGSQRFIIKHEPSVLASCSSAG